MLFQLLTGMLVVQMVVGRHRSSDSSSESRTRSSSSSSRWWWDSSSEDHDLICPYDCKTWFNGCTSCSCDEMTGEAECRRSRRCRPRKENSYCTEYYACPEGCSSFYDGCNTHECDPQTGEILASNFTEIPCEKYGTPQCNDWALCPEDCLVWNDGCNSCQCSDNGTITDCTERLCLIQGDPFCEEYEGVCPPDCNTTWFDGCNTCDCSSGVCTLKLCHVDDIGEPECIDDIDVSSLPPLETPIERELCWNGCDSYFDGCNWCSCDLETGETICTRIYCEEYAKPFCYVTRSDGCPDPNCDVWNDGCNTCYCDHETGEHRCTDLFCFWQGIPSCLSCQSNFEFNAAGSPCWQSNTCEDYPVFCRAMSRPMCTCPEELPIYDPDTNSCISLEDCPDEPDLVCSCESLGRNGKQWEKLCARHADEKECLNDKKGRCEWNCE